MILVSQRIIISKEPEEELTTAYINKEESTQNSTKTLGSEPIPVKIDEREESNICNLMYKLKEFNELSQRNQNLVEEAEKDSVKQFEVGRFMIEGKNDFPKNIKLGLQYIEYSINQKCVNAIVYYIELLIKGEILEKI